MPAHSAPRRDPLPLAGRTALVTGASRRAGIGHAVARRLAAYGASVYTHHHLPHDSAQPWGSDPEGPDALADAVRECAVPGATVAHGPGDLTAPGAPSRLVGEAAEALGGNGLDILVANHALSGNDGPLDSVDAGMLDAHWAVNTRSVILLVQAFARLPRPGEAPPGHVVVMTSGQDVRGGMPEEICYSLAKGALASSVRTLATALAPRITVNAVNPGPVDTGYLQGEAHAAVAALFPDGRWATPDDPARLVSWLTTDEAAWITGEVINSENGFAR
ncbi:3-ketoacyl-ACP reductase [Streptomyces abyssalis]|uniref:3-ketoacyl-ACP reductase n=1 Tax=Streptomyces abyssalis TaxID=933944 RepID=A0A1E7JVL9_9ACTN|nr:SDR family oxidoreductase [Streptomyces abyssalis]OEU94528.1 3-ketoacyl-ACP reductase [Streptomyces abyssalis]OEU95911.1 3-ketoacyl-ACP reductase [Streptomyces abyssalis]OEV31265.1 3-ketoacyl-ACP reductase [Streptomyces nanshensis]